MYMLINFFQYIHIYCYQRFNSHLNTNGEDVVITLDYKFPHQVEKLNEDKQTLKRANGNKLVIISSLPREGALVHKHPRFQLIADKIPQCS